MEQPVLDDSRVPGKERNQQQRIDIRDMIANDYSGAHSAQGRIDAPLLPRYREATEQEKAPVEKMV
jgi:hypothetical protein